VHLNRPVKGQRLDNLAVFSVLLCHADTTFSYSTVLYIFSGPLVSVSHFCFLLKYFSFIFYYGLFHLILYFILFLLSKCNEVVCFALIYRFSFSLWCVLLGQEKINKETRCLSGKIMPCCLGKIYCAVIGKLCVR